MLRYTGVMRSNVRVHFTEFNIPSGVQVYITNEEDPDGSYGPLAPAADTKEDYWAPTCFGKRIIISVESDPGTDINGLHLTIDKIAHLYKGFDALSWEKAADSCNLDVSCYPAWADVARGVAGIGTIGNSGVLWCTGTLLADTDLSTQIPYFLTAHHCVGGQSKASTLEIYWLYQTPGCNGIPPSPQIGSQLCDHRDSRIPCRGCLQELRSSGHKRHVYGFGRRADSCRAAEQLCSPDAYPGLYLRE